MKFQRTKSLLFSTIVTTILVGLLSGCASSTDNSATDASVENVANTHTENTQTFWIAPERVACQGIVPMQCLVVNKVVDGKTTEWQLFYSEIKGFDFEPGAFYKLSVATSEIDNPPADASSISYQLVNQDQKTVRHYKANTMLTENRKWNLKQLVGLGKVNPLMLDKPANITIAGDRLSGFSGCNNMFGQVEHLFEDEQVENSLLKLGPIGSTLMACPESEGSAVEQKLQQALGKVNAIHVQWPFLNMYYNDELIIQFVAEDWD